MKANRCKYVRLSNKRNVQCKRMATNLHLCGQHAKMFGAAFKMLFPHLVKP